MSSWNLKFLQIFIYCFLEFPKISYPIEKKEKKEKAKGSHVCYSAKRKQWIRENVSFQYMDKFAGDKDAILRDNIFCPSNLNYFTLLLLFSNDRINFQNKIFPIVSNLLNSSNFFFNKRMINIRFCSMKI